MAEQTDTRVAIVDDDDALRDALVVLVTAAGWRADPHASAELFLASLVNGTAGCALIDIGLPGINGMELFRKLGEIAPSLPVVIMTGHGEVSMAVDALKAGAIDFIEKPFDADRLLASLHKALHRAASTREAKSTLAEFQRKSDRLTPRENDVMECMTLGQSNKMIAVTLGISPRTVEVYRARVMEKMKVGSLAELVRLTIHAQNYLAGGSYQSPADA